MTTPSPTPSPTPEEIEAAARALFDLECGFRFKWEDGDEWHELFMTQALAALKAAMAVRRGK